jgi:hypothetical protein
MLGKQGKPSLLVNTNQISQRFKFSVINGCWEGEYTNGYISIFGPPSGDWTSLDKVEILCDNQDRLRGNYNDVFNNFDNEEYVAPKSNFVPPENWDDIPF